MFCRDVNGEQLKYPCCWEDREQYTCFQQMSPDPDYNMTAIAAAEVLSLSKICDTHKIIKKR